MAAVADGNATGSSGDSAPQLDAPSTPRKEAAVAADNACPPTKAPPPGRPTGSVDDEFGCPHIYAPPPGCRPPTKAPPVLRSEAAVVAKAHSAGQPLVLPVKTALEVCQEAYQVAGDDPITPPPTKAPPPAIPTGSVVAENAKHQLHKASQPDCLLVKAPSPGGPRVQPLPPDRTDATVVAKAHVAADKDAPLENLFAAIDEKAGDDERDLVLAAKTAEVRIGQDDNHKHRWNRMAGANHDGGGSGSGSSAVPKNATVVAENVCPPFKAHPPGHPTGSVVAENANPRFPKSPPPIRPPFKAHPPDVQTSW